MPHDEHFLQRLDRISGSNEQLELALGLYRDHELVRYVLDHVRIPEGAERVALALDDGGAGPHIIVARDGHFVTCLSEGMKTGPHPVVARAHLDALAAKVERVREGMALARERGLDSRRLLKKLGAVGPALSREDFLAAEALIGPASGMLLAGFLRWTEALNTMFPALLFAKANPSALRTGGIGIARGAWAMAHSVMLQIDTASREWVTEWASEETWSRHSAWTCFVRLSALPFQLRAAWIAARLGKPMLPSYKARFAKPYDAMELREAGWGLVAMGLRHQGLRSEIWRTLLGRSADASEEEWVEPLLKVFAHVARVLDEKEEQLLAEGMALGREEAVARTAHLPASSRHRYTEPAQVGDDVALPSLFGLWHDAISGEKAGTLTLRGLVHAARARAEDFYLPATLLHALGPPDMEGIGVSILDMRRKLVDGPRPAVRAATPGRNDACPCGSGKKYKKCHGR